MEASGHLARSRSRSSGHLARWRCRGHLARRRCRGHLARRRCRGHLARRRERRWAAVGRAKRPQSRIDLDLGRARFTPLPRLGARLGASLEPKPSSRAEIEIAPRSSSLANGRCRGRCSATAARVVVANGGVAKGVVAKGGTAPPPRARRRCRERVGRRWEHLHARHEAHPGERSPRRPRTRPARRSANPLYEPRAVGGVRTSFAPSWAPALRAPSGRGPPSR